MGFLIENEDELKRSTVSKSENSAEEVPFVENIQKLWLAGFACDVFFAVGLECKLFKAHRIVLAAASSYFREYFFGGERKAEVGSLESPIEVFDVTSEAMSELLHFLYSNQDPTTTTLSSKSVVHVLYAADKYKMAALRRACLFHIQNMSGGESVQVLRQAIFYHEEVLIHRCLAVIDENADEVLSSEGFLDCDRDAIAILVNRDTFKPTHEFPLFMALFSWSIVECDRRGLDITAANQRDVLGGLMVLVNLKALRKEEIADAVRTGLITFEEVSQFVPNPWDSKLTNLFEEDGDNDSEFQQLAVNKQGYVTISLSNDDEAENDVPTDVPRSSVGSVHGLYYTVSRFQHSLKSSTTTNHAKLVWHSNRNVDFIGFSLFGFCDGRNNEIFSYKPTVSLRRLHGLHLAHSEKISVDIVPFKHLIRFMFKEKRPIKRDKKYSLEVKFEGMAHRTRLEGFGESSPEVKLHSGDSVAFSFDGDRYIAELYFVPIETLGRISMIPLKTDFIRNLSEENPSKLKLRGSRWTS